MLGSTGLCPQAAQEAQQQGNKTHREEEEELVQLPLQEEVGQVAHCIGPERCYVGELAGLLPPQGCHPLYYVIGDLHHTCQYCITTCQG